MSYRGYDIKLNAFRQLQTGDMLRGERGIQEARNGKPLYVLAMSGHWVKVRDQAGTLARAMQIGFPGNLSYGVKL